MTITKHRRRPANPFQAIGGKLALAVLHSPLRFVFEPGIAELRFTGRRTGSTIRLPVMYARAHHQIAVLAGGAHRKTWWRNFVTPHPLQATISGQTWDATAVVVSPATPAFTATLALYRRRFPHAHYRPGDRLIAITLHGEKASGTNGRPT